MNRELHRYYALHSRIYDITRWSFLFGREKMLHRIAAITGVEKPMSILEVGCGTGHNLRSLRKIFPKADLTGVDLSEDMLRIARRKTAGVRFIQQAYDAPLSGEYDIVLFSYALSMFNPGWENAIRSAQADLKPGGMLAIVDFSHTKAKWFQKWMGKNHVRMEGHLWPEARSAFVPLVDDTIPAYLGIWHYGQFIGQLSGDKP